jgi:ABC-type polysaccharide/polyol phosphate export permease
VEGAASDARGWIENRPTRGLRWPNLNELWQYRELAAFLALRDLKVRYKQAFFGAAWAIVQPLAAVVVFTVVFRRFAHVPSEGIPYPIFALAGLTAWTYTSTTVTKTTQSLVGDSALITKVYFPRLIAPMAALFLGLVDLSFSLLLLFALMPIYHVHPGPPLVTLPIWIAMMICAVFGVGLWLGTLNVTYRDVNQAIGLLVQLWMFASPVAYPSSVVPDAWRPAYFLNPMAGVIESLRWALVGTPWPGNVVLVSLAATLLLLVTGVLFFEHTERRFADVI